MWPVMLAPGQPLPRQSYAAKITDALITNARVVDTGGAQKEKIPNGGPLVKSIQAVDFSRAKRP